jgi:hypothetical protein
MTHTQLCELLEMDLASQRDVAYMQKLQRSINDALQLGSNVTWAGSINPWVLLLNQFKDEHGLPILLLVESDKYDAYSGTPEYIVAFILKGFKIPDIEQATVSYAPHFPNWFAIQENWYNNGNIDVGDDTLVLDNPKRLRRILEQRYTLVDIQMPEIKGKDWDLFGKLFRSCKEVWGYPHC